MNFSNSAAVPHLTTAMTGPLHDLEQRFLTSQVAIETWLRRQWQKTPAPIYSSVDLRNAGFKIAPVDTNLFPAGFNNLNRLFFPLCIQAMETSLIERLPQGSQIALIPESHSRNLFYFESLATLQEILSYAGFAVRIASLREDLAGPTTINLNGGRELKLHPIARNNNQIAWPDFMPDGILLNHDLSEGIPEILQGLTQPVFPSPQLGWSTRLKSQHFSHYQQVAEEFAQLLDIDPWLINPLFRQCRHVDFMAREGEQCLVHHATELFAAISQKYQQFGIEESPFLIVKADAGTYGMGIMTVHSPQELQQLNRKERSRMAMTKGNQPITKVLLQEGVRTIETWQTATSIAEPVVYMIGHSVVGGFYRVNQKRSDTENLNAPGMQFEPLSFAAPCNQPNPKLAPTECVNRFYTYGVIARLAALAAGREARELDEPSSEL